MHTQCPRCKTVFAISDVDLRARDGLVRCGRCRQVFQADTTRVEGLTSRPAASPEPSQPELPMPGMEPPPAPEEAPVPAPSALDVLSAGADDDILLLHEVALAERLPMPGRRWPLALGAGVALVLLAFQVADIERNTLASVPWLRPSLQWLSRLSGGPLERPVDLARLEIRRPLVSDHPKYQEALRVAVTLINRASHPQPYPRIVLSLFDAEGALIARRSYGPADYHEDKTALMPPDIAERIHFGVTRPPNAHTLSYELTLAARTVPW